MPAKESVGTALIGLWCFGSAWTRRPMTFYTARPLLTKGRPVALRCWDSLADRSPAFRSIQRRLATSGASDWSSRRPCGSGSLNDDFAFGVFSCRNEHQAPNRSILVTGASFSVPSTA